MDALPNYGLANTVTGFCTLFAGLMPLLFSTLTTPHPPRWMLVYWLILITGIFTVTLHGFGETNPILGERWMWAFLDTGSNIVVVWGIARAVLIDYYRPETQRWALPVVTLLMILGVAWHFVDKWNATHGAYVIGFGDWGGFRPGQTWLIGFSVLATVLFFVQRAQIAAAPMRILLLMTGMFLCGLLLATAKNSQIVYPFIPMHALWHVVGAFGFIALWFFNELRFPQRS
ncbi:MAG TPA: hypothetical protein DCL54_07210 [Alphaproteobacteria bacterium]|nr:hypothetical protein [Alphaproteobacteria bacterium]HAJ46351.1 hypothetical protein [Alphaproteobacteria bacterium]